MRPALVTASLLIASCSSGGDEAHQTEDSAVAINRALPSLEPAAPGEPGGLADDRAPIAEGPIEADSAQGAAQVVQSYFALLEQRRYPEAWRLWGDGGRASGLEQAEFATSFARYGEYHAQIGAPGRIEGAAGSLYVEVPVQVYGRLVGGEPFTRSGTITLRRVNDVPGSTLAQRRWHIDRSEVEPG